MTMPEAGRVPGWRDWGLALAIFTAGILLAVAVNSGRPLTRGTAVAAAAVTAATTLAVTAWSVRFAVYPRWAYWASAATLGLLALVFAATTSDLEAWNESIRSSLWMSPWYPLVLTTAAGSSAARACAAGTVRGGLMMVAAAVFLGTIEPLFHVVFGP